MLLFYFFLGLEFIGIIILIVYIGAVAVLFLFIVMMLNIKLVEIQENLIRFIPISTIIGFLFFFEIYNIISISLIQYSSYFYWINWYNNLFFFANIHKLAQIFFYVFYYEFIISGIILLIAMIGAISLCLSQYNIFQKQELYLQINAQINKSITLC